MERNNIKRQKIDTKPKRVCRPTKSCNIQPRVVLQRLGKDFTFGGSTSRDNQPSTSGYFSQNQNEEELDFNKSDTGRENNLNTGNEDLVLPSTSNSNTPTVDQNKGVIEFRVAQLTDTVLYNSSDNYDSDSSDSSPPEEIIILDDLTESDDFGDSDSSIFNYSDDEYTTFSSSVPISTHKATTFLALLIGSYARQNEIAAAKARLASASGRRYRIKRSLSGAKSLNLKGCLVRVLLPITGKNRRKKFYVKLSTLIYVVQESHHPLHKFRNSLTLQNLKYLTRGEMEIMARILAGFVCAQPVALY